MSSRDRRLRRKSKKYQNSLKSILLRARFEFVDLKQDEPSLDRLKEKAVAIYQRYDSEWQIQVVKAKNRDNLKIDPKAFQKAIAHDLNLLAQ